MTMPMVRVEVDFSRPQSLVEALRRLQAGAKVASVKIAHNWGDIDDGQLYRDMATILQAAADTAQDAVTLDAARI